MRHPLIRKLEASPVLPSVKEEACLPLAASAPAEVVFLLGGDLLTIPTWIAAMHHAGKSAVVHLDLVAGLSTREVAVDWLRLQGADGIISTRPHLIRRGRELGLLTVLRVFAIDSKAVGNLTREAAAAGPDGPDFIEILPGTLPRVIARLSGQLSVPLIAGGLMADKTDLMAALSAGALCVSTSDPALWES